MCRFQCFIDTIIKDNGYLNAVMICGSIVVVDVEMNESDDNRVQRVNVSFAIETDKDSRVIMSRKKLVVVTSCRLMQCY